MSLSMHTVNENGGLNFILVNGEELPISPKLSLAKINPLENCPLCGNGF